jgi:hypothetical protein
MTPNPLPFFPLTDGSETVPENVMKSTIATPGSARLRRRVLCLAVSLMLSGTGTAAMAQDAAPSTSVTINLIHMMVKKGLLTQSDADGLLAQAQADAAKAQATAAAANDGAQPGDVRVPYVSPGVRNQIRDEVKQEVIAQAKSEHWAEPNAMPEWLDRISWSGDIRVRDESWFYSRRNDPNFINYAALNSNGPYDVNAGTNQLPPPFINSQQNRTNMLRLQAHMGMSIKLGDTITAGIRIGTGGDDSPVSTTQTLGGGLTKKDLWLDQAWIQWKPNDWSAVIAGRMPDPFFVTDLMYSSELNFDGVAGHFDVPFGDHLGAFATVGMFPMSFTGNDTPTNAGGGLKNKSDNDKWMAAAQIGATWQFSDDMQWKVALSYFDFDNMRGSLSDPCPLYLGVNYCSTDASVPAFMQKGNTVFTLRDIVPDPNNPSNYAQPQFVGLSYNYRVMDLNNQFDFKIGGTPIRLQADYERNMAYHARSAFRYPDGLGQPVNNYQAGPVVDGQATVGQYKSGPVGWMVRGIVGNPHPMAANEWNVALGYKYLQPDATLDGLTDPNFHLGGTNAKGFIFTADYGIAERTWLSARYFNAKEIYGPPLAIDVLQLEINSKF